MTLENKKQVIFMIAAVVFGLIAAIMLNNYTQGKISEERKRIETTFAEQIEVRSRKHQQQMATLNKKIIEVQQQQQQAIKKATEALKKQQAAADSKKVEKKRKPSLALRTPVGKRALTVLFKSLGAVGGLVNPGDFVDVVAHLNVPVNKRRGVDVKENVTVMVFQNLQILAINTNLDDPGAYDDQQKMSTLKITFAVDPEEVGLMSFAEKNGKLELALRSPKERRKQITQRSTWETLAEYVLENQGSDIPFYKKPDPVTNDNETQEMPEEDLNQKPYIQIFRGGKEL